MTNHQYIKKYDIYFQNNFKKKIIENNIASDIRLELRKIIVAKFNKFT